jgi:hypothetical protein
MGPLEKAAVAPAQVDAVTTGMLEVRLVGEGAHLVVTGGGSYVLGSGTAAPLRIEHPSVAEVHARLIVSDALGTVFIQREGGRTLRNGQAVDRPEPLADGDDLQLGDAILRVRVRRVGNDPG